MGLWTTRRAFNCAVCHGDIDLSQPGIARCLRDYANGGEGVLLPANSLRSVMIGGHAAVHPAQGRRQGHALAARGGRHQLLHARNTDGVLGTYTGPERELARNRLKPRNK